MFKQQLRAASAAQPVACPLCVPAVRLHPGDPAQPGGSGYLERASALSLSGAAGRGRLAEMGWGLVPVV